jgi:hypothetical protein
VEAVLRVIGAVGIAVGVAICIAVRRHGGGFKLHSWLESRVAAMKLYSSLESRGLLAG